MSRSLAPSPIASVSSAASPSRTRNDSRVRKLRLAPQDGFGDFAHKFAAGIDQELVGTRFIKTDALRDPVRKRRKAPGDEARIGAVGPHRGYERAASRSEHDSLCQHVVNHVCRQSLEQRHPLAQSRRKRKLSAHGTLGDGSHMRLLPDQIGELVDALLADHGRIHVGHEQPFAPAGNVLHHDIDGLIAERFPHPLRNGTVVVLIARAKENVRRAVWGEPFWRARRPR